MYLPKQFEEKREEILIDLIQQSSLGCLVSYAQEELDANHLPFIYDAEQHALLAHIALDNPLAKVLAQAKDVLVVFKIDDAYVSPNWYKEKFEHHRAVPTWNYVVIHVKGTARVIQDEKTLRGILAKLTRQHESNQPRPWRMSDAPPDYIQQQLNHIVAIQIEIKEWVGKFKLSQNRNEQDIVSVAHEMLKQGKTDLSTMMREGLTSDVVQRPTEESGE